MLQNFSHIEIDNLNGDKYRTGKTTPEGLPDPSVFSTKTNKEGIQPGTAITTLLRANDQPARAISLRSLWGEGKLAQLKRETSSPLEIPYVSIIPEPLLGLPYAQLIYTQQYLGWPLLSELFQTNFNGVQTSRDNLLVEIDRHVLEGKMQRFLTSSTHLATYNHWHIRRYLYRPFDVRFVYWEGGTELLVRSREEYIGGHFENASIVLSKQDRVCYSGPIISSSIVDLNSVDGGANVFAEAFTASNRLHGPAIVDNWSTSAVDWVQQMGADKTNLFLHVLAVTHCPIYMNANVGALQRDWPRIPLPATAALLTHSATLGRRLADLLDPESSLDLAAEWSFLSALKLPPKDPRRPEESTLPRALQLTAGWGARGQGSTVMPGRGRLAERPWTAAEREKLTALAATQSLTPETALTLLGETCVDVYLNSPGADETSVFWSAVPIHVWKYTLGGYLVLKKWLSYRELPLLGRPLHPEEAAYFAQVVRRISAILLLGPALDSSYAAILPTATGLPTP